MEKKDLVYPRIVPIILLLVFVVMSIMEIGCSGQSGRLFMSQVFQNHDIYMVRTLFTSILSLFMFSLLLTAIILKTKYTRLKKVTLYITTFLTIVKIFVIREYFYFGENLTPIMPLDTNLILYDVLNYFVILAAYYVLIYEKLTIKFGVIFSLILAGLLFKEYVLILLLLVLIATMIFEFKITSIVILLIPVISIIFLKLYYFEELNCCNAILKRVAQYS